MKKTVNQSAKVCFAVFVLFLAAACSEKNEEQIVPPETHPLSQSNIGYGVVNVLYTSLNTEAASGSGTAGSVRMGTVLTIYERKSVINGRRSESWLLVETENNYKGWILEEAVNVYPNLPQARVASEAMR
jgi:uncharacterized protein YgiM (DUF1202 family)